NGIGPGERDMVRSVFELGDTIVREVMVPRTDMVFIEADKTVEQALSLALRSGFSRIPVVGENEDDVVGIAYLKDIVAWSHEHPGAEATEKVATVVSTATYVPDSKPVDELLRQMQAQRIHVAIAGSSATVNGLRLTAESLEGRRNKIGTLLVERVPAHAS